MRHVPSKNIRSTNVNALEDIMSTTLGLIKLLNCPPCGAITQSGVWERLADDADVRAAGVTVAPAYQVSSLGELSVGIQKLLSSTGFPFIIILLFL